MSALRPRPRPAARDRGRRLRHLPRAAISRGVHAADDDREAPLRRLVRGADSRASARTSPTTRDEHEPHQLAVARPGRARGRSSRSRSGSTSSSSSRRASPARPPTATTAAGRSSRRRSTWRCARRGRSLGDVVGREARPVTLRLLDARRLARRLARALPRRCASSSTRRPTGRTSRSPALAARGNVDVVDLKGAYHGTRRRQPAEPGALPARRRGASRTRGSRIPRSTPETDAVLEPHRDRITWDAPIHSWADVEALPFAPRCLNCKPSRFGSVERLFEFYDRCAEHGIALYGGGQFELGVGRGQIQLLASLFHPGRPERRGARRLQLARAACPGCRESPLDPSPERRSASAARYADAPMRRLARDLGRSAPRASRRFRPPPRSRPIRAS